MTPPGTTPPVRFERIDALRGAAIIWMAVFHFCFDLNHFGLWQPHQAFTRDPFWTLQRTAIVTLFLLCAGLGQAVALRHAPRRPVFDRRFWRRWLQVAGCAVLVSLGSAWMFPNSWIFFGVLHGIAVMLLLTRLVAPLPVGVLALLAVAAIALPQAVREPLFDARAVQWVGLGTHKPRTEDWVPLLPWAGVVWAGFVAGRWLLRQRPSLLTGALPPALRPLAVLGRWSLSFYMLHQPVFIGGLMAGRAAGWW